MFCLLNKLNFFNFFLVIAKGLRYLTFLQSKIESTMNNNSFKSKIYKAFHEKIQKDKKVGS
jgi:hypothetical protein